MVILKSHGFKYERPEANYVFDVSFLKNPWRDAEIRNEKDIDKRRTMIIDFMYVQPATLAFVEKISSLIRMLNTFFPHENIVVALCCSAGEYRSPALVDMLGKELKKQGIEHKIMQSKYSKI